MTFLISALALTALFRLAWNIPLPVISFVGGTAGLVAQKKRPTSGFGVEDGIDAAGQTWKWLGAFTLAALLAAVAVAAGADGSPVPLLFVSALLVWHMMVSGGFGVIREAITRGDPRGVRIGSRDMRWGWLPAGGVFFFSVLPGLLQNPVHSAALWSIEWSFARTSTTLLLAAIALFYLLNVIVSSARLAAWGYSTVRRRASRDSVVGNRNPDPGSGSRRPVGPDSSGPKAVISCPQCAQKLSVPTGKGEIAVNCPKCGSRQLTTT